MRGIWEAHRDYSGAFSPRSPLWMLPSSDGMFPSRNAYYRPGGVADSPPHRQQRPVSPRILDRSVCAMGAVRFALISVFDRGRFRWRAMSVDMPLESRVSRRLQVALDRLTLTPYHQFGSRLIPR